MDISIKQSSLNLIYAAVRTFVYAQPIFSQRRHFWTKLQELNTQQWTPCCCIGDFNEILEQHEKQGLRDQPESRMQLFRDCLDNSNLMDMDLKGCKFTWCSNPRQGQVTKEKLDKILINWPWRALYPNSSGFALPIVSSDHSPLLLRLKPLLRPTKLFRFEALWVEDE
ncbi:uncharacterized protein LOC130736872 [Lotus japonicus]|uniref:uncharacterized protein LOC130736872 n=1 Tax=Lotus japonicus TaxID=34305 RepID=UPI00258D5E86|nr:uncharacterized protein LOC130736872 [Lotus japonicus]